MSYTKNDPKWVQAESVQRTAPGYVTVTVEGETFENQSVQFDPYVFYETKTSHVLVQNSFGDWWLRVWFYDKDVK